MVSDGGRRRRAIAATTLVAAITAVDLYTALRRRREGERVMNVRAAITVNSGSVRFANAPGGRGTDCE